MTVKKIVTEKVGKMRPDDIESFVVAGGFEALGFVRGHLGPDDVIAEVTCSGLRGRGGGGFPCGPKWKAVQKAAGEPYFVCNADEGEVGAFKDRFLMENDPFTLLEGILIGCYAVDAKVALIYLRNEYHYLKDALERAIQQCGERGILRGVSIKVLEGAGAYVCGEETGLLNSVEGRRGEPRHKPPYPTDRGLWDRPTVINNVETLMNIPTIILRGADWFSGIGTDQSKGTKAFSVCGDVVRPGVYELEMGSTLRELVVDCAGAGDVAWVQVGGASGKVLPAAELDTVLSFETVLGSGAVLAADSSRDVIDFAYWTEQFFAEESCGQCTPCREGTRAMVGILERLSQGRGRPGDTDMLERLSALMMETSICGLGKTAPTAVIDTLRHYRNTYEDRIAQAVYLRGQARPGRSITQETKRKPI